MSTLQPDTLIKNPQGCQVVSSVEGNRSITHTFKAAH